MGSMNITVLGDKGGVGKTTTAIHLAGYLGERYGPGEVTLVDGDPNESALDYAADGDWSLPFSVAGEGDEIRGKHVVFDSQGRLGEEDFAAAVGGSDLMVIPSLADRMSLKVLVRFLEDVKGAGEAPYRVLLMMVPWWEARLGCPAAEELSRVGEPYFNRIIEYRRAFTLASDAGLLVRDLKGRAAKAAWKDYCAVGDEIVAFGEREGLL